MYVLYNLQAERSWLAGCGTVGTRYGESSRTYFTVRRSKELDWELEPNSEYVRASTCVRTWILYTYHCACAKQTRTPFRFQHNFGRSHFHSSLFSLFLFQSTVANFNETFSNLLFILTMYSGATLRGGGYTVSPHLLDSLQKWPYLQKKSALNFVRVPHFHLW